MDLYLEAQGFWPDFHATFINYWREALADLLPPNYEARIGERVNLVERPPEVHRRIEPDVAVSQRGPASARPGTSAGTATLEPVTIPLVIEDEVRETFIEILHRPDRSLVAVLELLSPANKEEPGRGAYLARRMARLHQTVHLVELDLLLGGQRLPLGLPYPPGDYFALVAPGDRRPYCDVYGWALRHPLPAIPIPLRPPDPPVRLDLAAVVTTAYDRGRYAHSVDYTAALRLPLAEDERRWAEEWAQAAR